MIEKSKNFLLLKNFFTNYAISKFLVYNSKKEVLNG